MSDPFRCVHVGSHLTELEVSDIRAGLITQWDALDRAGMIWVSAWLRSNGWILSDTDMPFRTVDCLPPNLREYASKALLRRTRAKLRAAGYRRLKRQGREVWAISSSVRAHAL